MRYLAAVLMAVSLAACSNGTETTGTSSSVSVPTSLPTSAPSAPSTPTPTPAPADSAGELEAAVRSYSDAFLSGDGATAYDLLSGRCRDRTPLSEFAAVVEQAEASYGPMEIESLKVTLNGEQGQATYEYADASLNQDREPWVNEAGWRNDDC